MSSSKPAAQLRVTLKKEIDHVYTYKPNGDIDYSIPPKIVEITPLGFAQDYTPQVKTFEKRKHTQDMWAYGFYKRKDTYIEKDGKMWERRSRWDPDGKGGHIEVLTETLVDEKLQPRIIDNIPLDGFRITKSVSRYSTSNKLWRILDPRGFELEITSANLEELILNGVIVDGWISGQCQWVGKTLTRIKK